MRTLFMFKVPSAFWPLQKVALYSLEGIFRILRLVKDLLLALIENKTCSKDFNDCYDLSYIF